MQLYKQRKLIDAESSIAFVTTYFIGLFGILICIDLFDVFGKTSAPELLSAAACRVLPLTKPLWVALPPSMSLYLQDNCTTGREPVISLIFFLLKITITIVAAAFYWIPGSLLSNAFTLMRDSNFKKFREPNGLKSRLGMITAALTVNLALAFGIFQQFVGGPERFLARPFHKIMEDGVAFFMFFFVTGLIGFAIIVPLFLIDRESRDDRS